MVLVEQLILMDMLQPAKLIQLQKDVLWEHLLHLLMLVLLGPGRVLVLAGEQRQVVLLQKLLAEHITIP